MSAQLQFRDVTLGYDRHPAVHHLSGEVAQGALLAVVGPNGAGKSTLFRGLVGILKPLAGAISLRLPRSASPASRTAASARCRAARCSACCSPGCCCRTPG